MLFNYTARLPRHFHAFVVILSILISGCSEQLIKTEPTLQDALDASASDLALSYLSMKHTVRFVAIGERATVTIGNITINKDNVAEYKAKFEGRLSLYEKAIRQRGFKTVAGLYKGEATESCVRTNAIWAALIQKQSQKAIEITQEVMDAQVVITVEQEGKEISLKNPAAIAESAIAVNEATNSDYYFRGEIKNKVIVFRPDVSVLNTWPKWAKPPSRRDLEECIITLERI
jgi:head-tail adaptor